MTIIIINISDSRKRRSTERSVLIPQDDKKLEPLKRQRHGMSHSDPRVRVGFGPLTHGRHDTRHDLLIPHNFLLGLLVPRVIGDDAENNTKTNVIAIINAKSRRSNVYFPLLSRLCISIPFPCHHNFLIIVSSMTN